MDKYWFVLPRILDLAMLSTTWAYSRVFVKINLVMYGIGESALVIQGKNGDAWIYLSLYANHHFEPHLEKLELYIIHRDASYNYKYLRIRDADCFFLQDTCLNFPGLETVALGVAISIRKSGIGVVRI